MQKIPMCSSTNPQAEIYQPLACMVQDNPGYVWHAPTTLTLIGLAIVVAIIFRYAYRVYKEPSL